MSRVRQKILVVIGTRPEAIKMAPVIHTLQSRRDCQVRVCVTGQHREMIEQQLPVLRIRADYELKLMRRDQDLKELTERILVRVGTVLKKEKPNWALVQGDSTTAMAGALAAFSHGVRIAHVEAGLRTHDEHDPFPEEVNRRIADSLASLHFAPTKKARANLLHEGLAPETIVVTGNPVIDVLLQVAQQERHLPAALARLPFSTKRVLVFTMHRRESFGPPLKRICAAVRELAAIAPDVHVACLAHRNPRVHSVLRSALHGAKQVTLLPPLPYVDFVELLKRSYLVMTDSGGLQEECPSLGKPVIVLRDKTERTEAVESGAAILAGRDPHVILSTARRLLYDEAIYRRMAKVRHLYGDGTAAVKIVARLLS
jgi:UDP-N-acetylglucosamine 2-epimerase (non-hydrolysing)